MADTRLSGYPGGGMRVSVYLFRDDAHSFGDLLRHFPEESRKPERRELGPGINLDCEVWVMPQQPKKPSWLKHISPLVEVSDLRNANSSVTLLFRASGRFFAICFGYAHSMLNSELLEPEFGLRVTANMADPLKVGAIQVRTVSENSRQQRSQTASKTRVAEFDLELETEWLRYLKADPSNGIDWASGVSGSQSLCLTTKKELVDFPDILESLLAEFQSDAYKKSFPYIDNFAPIPKADPVQPRLREALIRAIRDPDGAKIGVACPDDLLGAEVAYWKIFGDGKRGRIPIEELGFADVTRQLELDLLERDLEKLKIVPLNSSGEALRTKRPVVDYFVFELNHEGETYALCLGQWFRIASDYVGEIARKIDELEDVTDHLNLPGWISGSEGAYNSKVCEERGYVHFDARNFMIGGPHQKVEVCDFLTKEYDFVCVKKMEDSATMSHLFSQAAVSADLYSANAMGQGANATGYADHVRSRYRAKWGDPSAVESDRRMVLAIATDKDGPVAKALYFFSKVNLVQRVTDLRKSGFRVAIAKIARI
ncbi:TIGR04141 family sporadically distributed protein [Streptomyces sp. NPDC047023]|uniref:TIGR04141 family sporadically distributed protein n=1 Tax=Streptomyces sp. NPDC047023 TaxID=3155139 RepID=UPI0033C85AB7